MAPRKNAHCGYCGQAFAEGQVWPRTCAACRQVSYLNPLPVAVLLVPVGGGVLAVRRAIEPGKGRLALPGGFVDAGETWQQAAVRELYEETGARVEADEVEVVRVLSAPRDNVLLVFGIVAERPVASLPTFRPTSETSECLVLRAPQELAFDLHTHVLREFFARKGRGPGGG